ncbi:MAG: hypothetical protein EAZ57_01935 [Cytophagales bacterium]|nr:MAG: hypothetical protein EAZ67_02655 [Cytophagales bacterium]TAF61884.1 MAG: hypothetical protein EAZ57_01935 [Cytophagales bacterium]
MTQTPPSEPITQNKTPQKRNYLAVGEVFTYFFKKRPEINFNVKVMHGINKLSILMFLAALIIWTIKRLA